MSTTAVEALIAVVTFIASVGTSAFISGARWGRVQTTLADLEKDRVRQGDITSLASRLGRIEGMFTLTLRGDERHG